MAKDPAFLFYPNDYMGGTMGMTFEEKGAYMDLLVLQFNKGAFTIEQAKKVLNGSFDRLWPVLIEKFVEQKGRFLNQRLESEKEKRKVNAEKNKERIKNYWDKKKNTNGNTTEYSNVHTNDNTKSIPIENEIENENRNEDVNKDFGKSENLLPKMFHAFKKSKPNYPGDQEKDFKALKNISAFICKQSGISYQPQEPDVGEKVMDAWSLIVKFLSTDDFYSTKSLTSISFNIQSIVQKIQHESTGSKTSGKPGAKTNGSQLVEAIAKFRGQKQPSGHT